MNSNKIITVSVISTIGEIPQYLYGLKFQEISPYVGVTLRRVNENFIRTSCRTIERHLSKLEPEKIQETSPYVGVTLHRVNENLIRTSCRTIERHLSKLELEKIEETAVIHY